MSAPDKRNPVANSSPSSSDYGDSSVVFSPGETVQLERRITLFNGCTMLVGVIVGSGIFASTGEVLKNSGTPIVAMLVWIACGVYCIFGALCYAELGTMVPKSGGDYTYITKAFGPLLGYIFLWISLFIVNPSCIAVTALTFAKYVLKPVFCGTAPEAAVKLLAACALLIVALINCYRVSVATRLQSVSTFAKVGALAAIILCGVYYCIFSRETRFNTLATGIENTSPLPVAAAFCGGIFTFNGWAYLNLVAEEVKEPSKNLPRAILISLPLVTLLYLSINAAYFIVLTPQQIIDSQAVAVDFAVAALPESISQVALYAIPVFVAISCIGGLNGTIFTYARMFFAGAREGQLPELVAMINPLLVTPMVSVMLLTSASLALIFISSVETLIRYMAFSQILIFATVVAALLKLRVSEPHTPRPLKVNIIVPVVFIIVSAGVLIVVVGRDQMELVKAVVVILAGLIPYFLCVSSQRLPIVIYDLWGELF